MKSPYSNLPERQFWKLAIPNSVNGLSNFYTKRFSIDGKKIATAGSCFAQEIAKGLRKNGYTVVDKEPSPSAIQIRGQIENKFGYGLYSARHGNIYTARQLVQLTKEALGLLFPPPESYIWEKNGRFYDAFRPNVEPNGLSSIDEVISQRADHIMRFKSVLQDCDVFVFTLGLTETWINKQYNLVYPTAPGTIAGNFDSEIYEFHNFSFMEVYNDLTEFFALAKSLNEEMRFILTVSPVPLTATAVNQHILLSSVRSKSVLRAVADEAYQNFEYVDYFPSYEVFSTPFLGPSLFMDNKRNVSRKGVAEVMRIFFSEHKPGNEDHQESVDADQPICEEAMLDAFAGVKK
ncbi:hypothetical protein BM523_16015 [Alteromonas mediterranea]|uniref:GSCFA domain-containing protein n=1 Tax=Alteromonas mediterranea TaxID=314275 RepID=UPI000903F1C4|nr:GSCFA domain-containing protein [Alteromonas mediterranea]APD95377.1 hypothetical protein BM523_16015 [Alteromonas mediterranea]APD99010.1 hypothetical protein BM525_16035 [Alteromonas mediterranea]